MEGELYHEIRIQNSIPVWLKCLMEVWLIQRRTS